MPTESVVRGAIGAQRIILNVAEDCPVQFIGAGLDGEVRDAGLSAAVLGADGTGLQLEFADGVCAGAELVVTAALQIHAAERHASNENLMRVELATVHAVLKF